MKTYKLITLGFGLEGVPIRVTWVRIRVSI